MASTPVALVHGPRRHVRHVGLAQRALGAAAAAALGVDAYVHLHDAGFYDSVRTSVLSQGTLFRAQAIVSIAVALAVGLRPRRVWWAAALAVLASAAGAVVLYTYVNVGALGPLPNMYEPTWVLPGKLVSAWVEGAGVLIAAVGLWMAVHRHTNDVRRQGPSPSSTEPSTTRPDDAREGVIPRPRHGRPRAEDPAKRPAVPLVRDR